MAELKPCPFCGGTRLFVGTFAECKMQRYAVCCDYLEGGCGASIGGNCRTEREAIEAWNRRVTE